MKKILDATCGSRTMWFNKEHPAVVYADRRCEEHSNIWKSTNKKTERQCVISPDVQCDFTDLPFEDNTFSLVVFDPPHLMHAKETAWLSWAALEHITDATRDHCLMCQKDIVQQRQCPLAKALDELPCINADEDARGCRYFGGLI